MDTILFDWLLFPSDGEQRLQYPTTTNDNNHNNIVKYHNVEYRNTI